MAGSRYFLGLDSSTQSLSAVLLDFEAARIVSMFSVNYGADLPEYASPRGFLENPNPLIRHADPRMWAAALDLLFARMSAAGVPMARIAAISGSGQQHGTVYLNRSSRSPAAWRRGPNLAEAVQAMLSRRTAPIWMDSSTTEECGEITEAAGGADYVREHSGSVATERFSGPQIRKFWKESPGAWAATAQIHLVSSFMASLLLGESAAMDPGDGAGMNLMDLETQDWDPVLLDATAPGLREKLPRIVPSSTVLGKISPYFVARYGVHPETRIAAWSGDNPNSLIGVGGWRPGTAVISLGTSDTFFAAMRSPQTDPAGYGHVFGNPAGGFMGLVCLANGALAREAVRDRFGMTWADFERALERTPPGNHGNMMLPYFVPETTPLVHEAIPVYAGTADFRQGRDPEAMVRAVIEAQALRFRRHTAWIEGRPKMLRVTGGASVNTAICQVLADVFGVRLERLSTENSAALGAAMRAAQAVGRADWPELAERFAKPDAARAVLPRPEAVRVYEREVLPRFAKFEQAPAEFTG